MARRALAPLLAALAAGMVAAPAWANPATETVHTVEEGETLGGIANRAGVPAAVIAAANGLVEPYDVQAGQKLAIPRQRIHTVRSGDTLGAIAERYGVGMTNLAVANGLEPPYGVRIGQKLIVPAMVKVAVRPQRARSEPYFRRPHDGRVSLAFGRGHDGIDIDVAMQDMVRAAASGTVVFAAPEKTRFGRQVLIDHGNGWQTSYGHLSRITVSKGDVVKVGERIGLAGDAGIATRPELHFEIRHNGRDVDPESKLPPRGN